MRKEATIPLLRSESVISQSFFFKLECPLSFHIAVKKASKKSFSEMDSMSSAALTISNTWESETRQ